MSIEKIARRTSAVKAETTDVVPAGCEPYAHLTDAEIDEVIADWTFGDSLPEDRSAPFLLVARRAA